jgi:hypothetical protein
LYKLISKHGSEDFYFIVADCARSPYVNLFLSIFTGIIMKQNETGSLLTKATSKLCTPLFLSILALSSATALADSKLNGASVHCSPLASKCESNASNSVAQVPDDNHIAATKLVQMKEGFTTFLTRMPEQIVPYPEDGTSATGDRVIVNFDSLRNSLADFLTNADIMLFRFRGEDGEAKASEMAINLTLDPKISVIKVNDEYWVEMDMRQTKEISRTLEVYHLKQDQNRYLSSTENQDMQRAIRKHGKLFIEKIDRALDFLLTT